MEQKQTLGVRDWGEEALWGLIHVSRFTERPHAPALPQVLVYKGKQNELPGPTTPSGVSSRSPIHS